MAIGDAFTVLMGTAATNRQPSSGVFEEVCSIQTVGTNDAVVAYNGSVSINIQEGANLVGQGLDASAPGGYEIMNISHKIGNTVYIRKEGSSDTVAVQGVQVDA